MLYILFIVSILIFLRFNTIGRNKKTNFKDRYHKKKMFNEHKRKK